MTDTRAAGFPEEPAAGHPTVDQLAHEAEGLLDSREHDAVVAHLAECPDCGDLRRRLASVSAALRQDATVGPMPADVATRIDAALARQSSARLVEAAPDRAPSGYRRWMPRILGAAATVAVVVFAFAAIPRSGGGDSAGAGSGMDTSASAGDAAAQPESAPEALRDASGYGGTVPPAPGDVAQARRLAAQLLVSAAARETRSPGAAAESTATPSAPDSGTGGSPAPAVPQPSQSRCGRDLAAELDRTLVGDAAIVWAGQPAHLVVTSEPAADGRTVEGFVLRDCADQREAALYVLPLDTP